MRDVYTHVIYVDVACMLDILYIISNDKLVNKLHVHVYT